MAECDSCGKRPTKTNSGTEMMKDKKQFTDLCPFNRMADGRAFTDYRSKCQKVTNMNSYDERTFLMNNAEDIMETVSKKFICSTCVSKTDDAKSTLLPEKFKQVCDKNICSLELIDANGIGVGR
jgi:uncharacterized protein CbrC (UPF0167 family)